jgi:hypothetical protein
VSGHWHQHAEVAVAVKARGWYQRGEAVEQLERGQALRATATGARFRRLVDEVLAVALAQPVQGERWAGAVPEQPLAPGAVGGLDAHRAVDRKPAAMLPLPHRLRVLVRQQAAAHEHARAKRRRTCACTWAMALASSPVAALKMTPPVAVTSNTPSMTTQ